MNTTSWALLDSGPGDYAFNMGLDEALLEAMPRLARPILRFYAWTQPAASFGYFQRYTEVERLTHLRPLVRRPTAGGIVPHDADWTYSLVFPPSHPWYSLTARDSYRRMHQWIQAAFARLNVSAALAPAARKVQAGQCFIGYEEHDLLWRDRKIAGAAQRRRRDGLLIQGSVQPPSLEPARADWQRAMCEAAQSTFGVSWLELEPDELVKERAQSLAQQKYSQDAYNLLRR
jgi:lipoyl(octanoyl) transferase